MYVCIYIYIYTRHIINIYYITYLSTHYRIMHHNLNIIQCNAIYSIVNIICVYHKTYTKQSYQDKLQIKIAKDKTARISTSQCIKM